MLKVVFITIQQAFNRTKKLKVHDIQWHIHHTSMKFASFHTLLCSDFLAAILKTGTENSELSTDVF